jgi:hypothetical protein
MTTAESITTKEKSVQLQKDDVLIELESLGEGLNGFYNEDDPDDTPLLRFSCYVKGRLRAEYLERPFLLTDRSPMADPHEWVQIEDGSYCTGLPENTSPELLRVVLAELMGRLKGPIEGLNVKRAAEAASWIAAPKC